MRLNEKSSRAVAPDAVLIAERAWRGPTWRVVRRLHAGIHGVVDLVHASEGCSLVVKIRNCAAADAVQYQRELYPFSEGDIYKLLDAAKSSVPRPRMIGQGNMPATFDSWLAIGAVEGMRLQDCAAWADKTLRPAQIARIAGVLREINDTPVDAYRASRPWNERFRRVFLRTTAILTAVDPANARTWCRCGAEGVPRATSTTERSAALLHGDFSASNLLVAERDDRFGSIRAVLDWEWATIGDPFLDLARIDAALITDSANRLYDRGVEREIFFAAYGIAVPSVEDEWWRAYLLFSILAPLAACLQLRLAPHSGRAPETEVAAICKSILDGAAP